MSQYDIYIIVLRIIRLIIIRRNAGNIMSQARQQMANEVVAIPGIQGRMLNFLSDGDWHSLPEIASNVGVSKSSASRYLYFMLSRGNVQWKPDASKGPISYSYRLIGSSLKVSIKPYAEDPLDEVDRALQDAIGNRYYYAGLAARYIYQLYDRFGNLNLVEVKVPRKLAPKAAEILDEAVSKWYNVVPEKMPWQQIREAMQFGTVLRLIPHYVPREKGRHSGRNVEKLEYLLNDIRHQLSHSEFEALKSQAADQGLLALGH